MIIIIHYTYSLNNAFSTAYETIYMTRPSHGHNTEQWWRVGLLAPNSQEQATLPKSKSDMLTLQKNNFHLGILIQKV